MNQANGKKFDLISLGRIAIDLYAEQIGSPLEDVQSFSKYIGGSSGNIAYGSALQGLRVSMLARVGDDHFGRFIKKTLESGGVDTSHIIFDSDRLTALAILGIKDRETFPLLFYRHHCADMALIPSDFDEAYIASSRALLITGTHFSTSHIYKTSMEAIRLAKKNNLKVILDIDYRPNLWGLGAQDDGENRFIESQETSSHLQKIFPHCDLIVGTQEEFMIGGGSTNLIKALKKVRTTSSATLVLKRGRHGNSVFEDEVPNCLDDPLTVPLYQGVKVEVLNLVGAGDAFMSGYLRGWLREESPLECSKYANACGALVVSRHGCAPAIPTKIELDYYLEHASKIEFPEKDIRLNHLHRVTSRKKKWQELYLLAVDHRSHFERLVDLYSSPSKVNKIKKKLTPAEKRSIISQLKRLILQAIQSVAQEPDFKGHIGLLMDGYYGQELLNEVTGKDYWIARPVEKPDTTPLVFEPHQSIGTKIIHWPQEQIVKCLLFYHPDDPVETTRQQEEKVCQLYQAVLETDKELLLEIIPSREPQKVLPQIIKRFYQLGVKPDWWKLFPQSDLQWKQLSQIIEEEDPFCRGILLLGLNSSLEKLTYQFRMAQNYSWCKGFAVGRSIFHQPTVSWLKNQLDDQSFTLEIKKNYLNLIEIWRSNR